MNELWWNRKVEICSLIKYFVRNATATHGNGDRFIYDLDCSGIDLMCAATIQRRLSSGHKRHKNSHIFVSSFLWAFYCVVRWFVPLSMFPLTLERSKKKHIRKIFGANDHDHDDHDNDDNRCQELAIYISMDFRFFIIFPPLLPLPLLSYRDFESRVHRVNDGANTIILWHFVFRRKKIQIKSKRTTWRGKVNSYDFIYTKSFLLSRFANV